MEEKLTRVNVTVTGVEGPLAGVLGGAIVRSLVDTKSDLGDLLAVVELDALGGDVAGNDTASSDLGHDERCCLGVMEVVGSRDELSKEYVNVDEEDKKKALPTELGKVLSTLVEPGCCRKMRFATQGGNRDTDTV